MLSGSALKASVGGWVVWCGGPTHYFVNPNLELRLSWAVTKSKAEHHTIEYEGTKG